MLGLKATMPVRGARQEVWLTVQIIDNSGGLLAECINVLRFKSSKGLGRVGT